MPGKNNLREKAYIWLNQRVAHPRGKVSQLVKHETLNLGVMGSGPTLGASFLVCFSVSAIKHGPKAAWEVGFIPPHTSRWSSLREVKLGTPAGSWRRGRN